MLASRRRYATCLPSTIEGYPVRCSKGLEQSSQLHSQSINACSYRDS